MSGLNAYNSLAFLMATATLAWHCSQGHTGEESLSLVLLTLAAWFLEWKSLGRHPVDFSGGYVIYLATGFMGDAPSALLMLIGGAAVRSFCGKRHTGDLRVTFGIVAALAVLQAIGHFPQLDILRAGMAVLALTLWLFVFTSYNQSLFRRLKGSGQRLVVREEHEVNTVRRHMSFYALSGAALPLHYGWLLTLATPLCLVAVRAATNAGFRVHAKEATQEKEEARKTHQELDETKRELKKNTEIKAVLESVAAIFSKPLTPEEAFHELHRISSQVAPYRSIILFKTFDQERLEPVLQDSPETDLLLRTELTLGHESTLERAWKSNKPLRGQAKGSALSRLIPSESHLVALPVKPFGLLYFGRDGDEEFSKTEASRLWFVVQKAAPALVRAEFEARTKETMKSQARKSRVLQERVALSALLLEGAETMLACLSEEQIYETLESTLQKAIPHDFGVVVSNDEQTLKRRWGLECHHQPALEEFIDYVSEQGRSIYLPELKKSRYAKASPELDRLLACPINSERSEYGVLVLGCRAERELTAEQRDFVQTCSCLAASALLSLALSEQVKEAHEQVVQASKLNAIGQLAAGVAHELNSPLAAIGLALEAAIIRPEKSARKLERASTALDRARDIVSGLLVHSRHSGSTRELLSPQSIIQGTLDLVRAQLKQQQIDVRVDCQEHLDLVLANSTDFQQVLINLLLNAADAAADGPEVVVFARQDGTTIFIGVQDFGTGIPKKIQDRLFEPFFTTKPVGRGTGLGLSVCKQLVERHQGKLDFETEEGQGTTFTISVPARKPEKEWD
jgi:signal transduction histidine kinase